MSFELFEYKIEDLGKVITGKTPPAKISDAFSTQGIPFVTPKDMDGRRLINKTERYLSSQGVEAVRNCLLPQNSIAVSCIGSDMGKTVLLPGKSITNQQINAIVVDSDRFDYKYVYYYLSTLQDAFKAISGGSATPILNKGHFSQFKVSLPVKSVQKKIALILDSLDTKIEINTEINQTLEQMAQALFKSWFVDFEPVKAKIAVLEAGGSQEDATLAAMMTISGKNVDALAVFEREHPEQYAELKATAELFPSAMQDSELGEIPEGWSCKPISQIVMVKSGYAFKSKDFTDSGFPVIKIKNITGDGTVDVDNCQYVSSETVQGLNRFVIKNGDVLLAMTGATVGKVGVFVNDGFPAYLNQRVAKFECRNELTCNWFVYNIVSRSDFTSQILSTAQGSAQPNISAKEIENISRVLPLDSLIIAYESCVSKIYQFVMCNISKNGLLTQLRDTLLPKLLSGEITQPEVEQSVSEVENV
ncbi:TPA: restriction endonuclease subunit S [Serratia marcescens]|nr:restriction endonuclease subunit S [Serratia marcescens]HEJ8032758.1 restriction endonuclease subunit S [Serratia marcescens]